MSEDPLHVDPVRPLIDPDGGLTNPIGAAPWVRLADDQPLGYSDLKPSTTYLYSGQEYLTDQAAMPARARAGLRLTPAAERVRHPRAQRQVGYAGEPMSHGGHLIAVSLGGFPSGPNLFPQAGNFNLSAFAKLEHSWRHALREGAAVEVDIALAEGPHPATPSFVVVTHWEDGVEETLTFANDGHVL